MTPKERVLTAFAHEEPDRVPLNYYANPEIDRLYAEGRQEFDRAKRVEKYGRIQEILYDDQPYTWLFWRNSFYGFSKNLRGYVFSPRGPYHYSPGFGSLWKPRQE